MASHGQFTGAAYCPHQSICGLRWVGGAERGTIWLKPPPPPTVTKQILFIKQINKSSDDRRFV